MDVETFVTCSLLWSGHPAASTSTPYLPCLLTMNEFELFAKGISFVAAAAVSTSEFYISWLYQNIVLNIFRKEYSLKNNFGDFLCWQVSQLLVSTGDTRTLVSNDSLFFAALCDIKKSDCMHCSIHQVLPPRVCEMKDFWAGKVSVDLINKIQTLLRWSCYDI